MREVLLVPEAAWAMDCEVAEAIDWPLTAWALLLGTPAAVACALEAEGENDAVLLAANVDALWKAAVP